MLDLTKQNMSALRLLLLAGLISSFTVSASGQDAQPATPASDTIRFLGLIMQDETVSPEDKKRIETLRSAEEPVDIEIDGTTHNFLPPDPHSRDLLSFFHTPANLNELWRADTDKMRLFSRIAQVSPATRDRLTQFAASKFHAAVQESAYSNGYGPIRDEVLAYYNSIELLLGTDYDMARRIGFDAMVMVDEYNDDRVPDFVYNWLAPGD